MMPIALVTVAVLQYLAVGIWMGRRAVRFMFDGKTPTGAIDVTAAGMVGFVVTLAWPAFAAVMATGWLVHRVYIGTPR